MRGRHPNVRIGEIPPHACPLSSFLRHVRAGCILPLMKRRARALAALLALSAFSVSLAEQVWASTCAPVMASSAAVTQAADDAPPMDGCDREVAMPSGDGGDHSRPPAGGSDCPFQALAPGGCALLSFPAVAAALPAQVPTTLARIAPAGEAAPELLLASPRFRPPQA
jgi:hypothetical protein